MDVNPPPPFFREDPVTGRYLYMVYPTPGGSTPIFIILPSLGQRDVCLCYTIVAPPLSEKDAHETVFCFRRCVCNKRQAARTIHPLLYQTHSLSPVSRSRCVWSSRQRGLPCCVTPGVVYQGCVLAKIAPFSLYPVTYCTRKWPLGQLLSEIFPTVGRAERWTGIYCYDNIILHKLHKRSPDGLLEGFWYEYPLRVLLGSTALRFSW